MLMGKEVNVPFVPFPIRFLLSFDRDDGRQVSYLVWYRKGRTVVIVSLRWDYKILKWYDMIEWK